MRDRKASQSPREPGVGEGVRGRDREQALVFGAQPRERAVDRVERATDGGGCAAPRVGQRHAAFLAMEQRYAEPSFQQLDLITDRSLRHPEFGGRSEEHTSEIQSLMRSSYAVFGLNNKTPTY